MRRMITQKMIDYIKSLQNKIDFQDLDYLSNLSHIITLVEDGVEISGDLEVGGEVSAQKVIEAGDTELIDLNEYINSSVVKSHTLYAKAQVKGGYLNIIVSGEFIAQGSSSGTVRIIDSFYSLISSISDKIFRADGSSIENAPASSGVFDVVVAGNTGVRLTSGSFSQNPFVLESTASEHIALFALSFPTLNEDDKVFIDFRISLAL